MTMASWMMIIPSMISILINPCWNNPVPQLIDLTYDFFNMTPTYPTAKKFEVLNRKEVQLSETIKYKVQDFITSEHAGTHMDAPDHFGDHGWTIDQIPIEHLEGPAVVVNISEKAAKDRDSFVEIADIEEWEKSHGRIPPKSIVLMYSGWGQHWRNSTAYLGGSTPTDLHFPGFSGEVCRWLFAERSIVGIGVDTVSGDAGNSVELPCHTHLSEINGFILENVANVDKLPPSGAIIRAYPMKIRGGTGAPTRVIATIKPS